VPLSAGAYLLGVMPPELKDLLDLNSVTLLRRDPHYFLPTTGMPALHAPREGVLPRCLWPGQCLDGDLCASFVMVHKAKLPQCCLTPTPVGHVAFSAPLAIFSCT
jgi:hypothetical protein